MRWWIITTISFLISSTLSEVPKGYVVNKVDGHAYKLMYRAEPWIRARDKCADIGAKLAVPKSEAEFKFIQKIVRSMRYSSIIGSRYKLLVWLGIHNLNDYKTWSNIDGENIENTGFHTWAGHNGISFSADPAEPHCVGMDAVNFGLRSYWCNNQQPYICEINIKANTTI
ncbi:CD209 antigen [Aphomia sociella]